MTQWFCVRSATRQEGRAFTSITSLGIPAYLPMEHRWRAMHHERRRVENPLFAGYLFALMDPSRIAEVHDADGVHKVLGAERSTPTIPGAFIETLRAAEDRGAFDRTLSDRQRAKWKPNLSQSVKVVEGPYSGFIGQVIELRGKARALLLVEAFGRAQKIDRPISELEAA